MDVSLTEVQRRFVEAKVAAGEFASAEAVVHEAIDLLMDIEEPWTVHPEPLFDPEELAAIEEGDPEALRGEAVDGHETFASVQARIESLIRKGGLDA